MDILHESQDEELARYLVQVHFPWIGVQLGGNAIQLYEQGHAAMNGNASPSMQSLYDGHITFLLTRKLSAYVDLDSVLLIIGEAIHKPQLVSMILDDDIKGNIHDQILMATNILEDD